MRVWNHPAADIEMAEEAAYLERQLPGYGALFLATVASLRDKIAAFPKMFPEKIPGIRFCTTPVFRYVMPYAITAEGIVILAYAHTSRRPGYWQERIESI